MGRVSIARLRPSWRLLQCGNDSLTNAGGWHCALLTELDFQRSHEPEAVLHWTVETSEVLNDRLSVTGSARQPMNGCQCVLCLYGVVISRLYDGLRLNCDCTML